jgi:hypothetical protein
MQIALIENKPEFVELLLENGVDLNSYLKTRNLYYLYNSHYVIIKSFNLYLQNNLTLFQFIKIKTIEKKSPLFQFYKKKISKSRRYFC